MTRVLIRLGDRTDRNRTAFSCVCHMARFSINRLPVAAMAWLLSHGRQFTAVGCLGITAIAAGCQCSPLLNRYADCIDDINDRAHYVDRCYRPQYDLTRIGKADWCGTRMAPLCGCRCEENGAYQSPPGQFQYPQTAPYQYPAEYLPPGGEWPVAPLPPSQTPPEPRKVGPRSERVG